MRPRVPQEAFYPPIDTINALADMAGDDGDGPQEEEYLGAAYATPTLWGGQETYEAPEG